MTSNHFARLSNRMRRLLGWLRDEVELAKLAFLTVSPLYL